MKITLEIPTEHTATILATLATLMKPAAVEAQPDPAEGHPELPLMPVEMSVEEWAASRLPKPHRVTTECHKCGGGTGQEDPCVCAVRSAHSDDESEEIAETRWAVVPTDDECQRHLDLIQAWAEAGGPGPAPKAPEGFEAWAAKNLNDMFAHPGIDAADPLKVEMEPTAPVRDGDAELPFPEDFPELPPLPEGYSRWVYRGTFAEKLAGTGTPCVGRPVKYFGISWYDTSTLDGPFHHIEAI